MTSVFADQIHACTLILTRWRTVSLFLVQVLKQCIYVQYRAFIPPRSAWMMNRANIIISLAPGTQIIVKTVINVIIKSHSNLCFRNQEHSPFPYVLVYCCCEDTPEGQANGRKDWLLFPVSGSSLYGQLAPFVWGQKCSRISGREDAKERVPSIWTTEKQRRGTFGPGDKICSQSHGPLAT